MHPPGKKFTSIDAYHATFPEHILEKLDEIRAIIHDAVPEAEEVISYNMPAFRIKEGVLLYYAGYKKHIGFYPAGPAAIEEFRKELTGYKQSTGAIQFPLDQALPKELIQKIAVFRLSRVLEKAKAKK